MAGCSIDGCSKKAYARTWCLMHYTRWRRYGHPEKLSFLKGRTSNQRFWQYVQSGGPGECWLWTGGLLTNGYGSFRFERKSWPAHRWLWVQMNGEIEDGLVVRHKCDTPACVNPDHHELGTPADNSMDAVIRERTAKGSKNGYAKLTESIVADIKRQLAQGHSHASIASQFNVTSGCVSHISTGRTWKHVTVGGEQD